MSRKIKSLFAYQQNLHMWYFARFGTISTIWKTWKTPIEQCFSFTKGNTPPWVFFTFFKLHKWYQITQRITYTTFCRFLFHGEKLEYCEKLGVLESHVKSRPWKSVIQWSSVLEKCRGLPFIVKLEPFFYKNFSKLLKM